MTNHERKHLPADMAGLDGLIELLRADLPEVLCEKHWMVDFDAVEAQRVEAATQLQALAYRIEALEAENERLREELAEAYIKLSGKSIHASDCATSNAPAMDPGPCDCAALEPKQ